ncbi:type II toxin-antitoxin system RelE/ParE family toxin [Coxiella burnetii]|uniref:Plasmid stabilization system toxin protein n=2 Tax=Coxiella burnetii TaxID=777 RepID=Q83DQ2_COXBU|nr:type II toxin-antitoxin system RelE/ParE family toxin [Coxiella burnetii]NP_819674.1 plasmid stabilization system toxin protein [Coxiella burnetii RSA 493]AAO90188.1 plasmid stabilization system toxin protein [Coxiella burnetii RSA 493]ABS76942.1 plasmid stabilization system toxin protein [Coxiella burnetii Dugway 5J108-111]ACJ18666.1 plasmid stabilization system toxin protein [Coxiella burnetii CbuG_Q212]ACJ20763.1 plasmid stabilization system toxin protein [Coxiella burnetii CbuK_Q154]AI
MNYKVVFLQQAQLDLKELKNYMINNFSKRTWCTRYEKIKKIIHTPKLFPDAGSIPPELETLNLNQYRQAISGKNRIIYELKESIVYIHIICDVRKDMKSLLLRRLFRSESLP